MLANRRTVAKEAFMMRAIPLTAILTFAGLLLWGIDAHADGTGCAQYGGTHGGTNCGFYSFQQCEAARSGNGGGGFQKTLFSLRVWGRARRPPLRRTRD